MKTQILINPDDESYTEKGLSKAINKLSSKYQVEVSEIPNSRCDKGFGQEATFEISGNQNNIDNFMDDLPDWAADLS